VPTFAEVLDLRARLSAELGRAIGVYPETKNPGYFAARGVPLEPALVATLGGATAPVFVQSFDPGSLRLLRRSLDVPLVQLVDERAECAAFLAAGVDGLFADHPATAVAARDQVRRSAGPRSTSATARPARTSA
jgi:glycerophosphoryl diester phosphodiesterase